MLAVSVVITTSLSSRSAPFGAPGVCYNLRFIIDVEAGPERSEEPTDPMKTDFDAAGIARKRGERTFRCQYSWHLKVTARGAWGSHTRAHQDHDAAKARENFITGYRASFERRVCSIEVKWASVEENVSTFASFPRAT